jgi:hypothetical protein
VSAGPSYDQPGSPDSGSEISLASLLNVLWRRRIIVVGLPLFGLIAGIVYGSVVTPLYEARAIVRPGITEFGTRGGGYREWKLKDLSRWYGSRLYRTGVADELGVELWQVPRIRADFVMRGLQTTEGGNVLTLTVLDPDPERGRQVLDASIDAFGAYVLSDSTSNSLVLSERGLMIQIEDKKRELVVVENEAKKIRTDLANATRDSISLDEHQANAKRLIDKMVARTGRIEADLATNELRAERLRAQIDDLGVVVEGAKEQLFDENKGAQLDPAIKATAQMTETEAYRGLLGSLVSLNDRLQQVTTAQDSLRLSLAEQDLEIRHTQLNQRLDFELKRRDAGGLLSELRLQLSSGIELQKYQLELQIEEREAQIAALSPIERVGPITASPRPVRPRKFRAVSILTFAGLLGGLGLAFVWDYVWTHRREIFSRTAT